MEINQDYMHFKRWYKDTERAIHCGQWDDEQIAYAGYCEGMKRVKTCNKPAVSKCEEFEREALLLASFLDWLESVSENSVDREWIQDYFKYKSKQ